MNRRSTLLQFNNGCWDSLFIRFDRDGLELERFPCRLQVLEQGEMICSTLTYLETGKTGQMRFLEPPAEMQITSEGHWSLGPTQLAPESWVAEFCLGRGGQRRRAVIRHGSRGLESMVLIREWRSGSTPVTTPPELTLQPADVNTPALGGLQAWSWCEEVTLLAMAECQPGQPQLCGLRWHQAGGPPLEILRRHDETGQLLPLPQAC